MLPRHEMEPVDIVLCALAPAGHMQGLQQNIIFATVFKNETQYEWHEIMYALGRARGCTDGVDRAAQKHQRTATYWKVPDFENIP